jgi:hypothetical protein
MLPAFTSAGFLPVGNHNADWFEFVARYGFNSRRQNLLEGMQQLLNLLAFANCTAVQFGGSFVSNKPCPSDFDGIYMLAGVNRPALPLEIDASVQAQADIFGGSIVPEDWVYTDIGHMGTRLQTTKQGLSVGIVVLNPQTVPVMQAWPRYHHFFPAGHRIGPPPAHLPLADYRIPGFSN